MAKRMHRRGVSDHLVTHFHRIRDVSSDDWRGTYLAMVPKPSSVISAEPTLICFSLKGESSNSKGRSPKRVNATLIAERWNFCVLCNQAIEGRKDEPPEYRTFRKECSERAEQGNVCTAPS